MLPEWVQKYKRPETTVKKIGNNYYLYHATSKWSPEKNYPESVQTYIGKIIEDGVVNGKVSIDISKTEACLHKIKEKGGHFCLQLKRNQKNAFEDVELFFSDMEKNHSREFAKMDYCMQEEKNHGRIEKREYRVFTEQEEIKRAPDTKWGHVECLGMAKLTRKKGSTVSEEIHYHLPDTAVSAEKYGSLAREHWEIENSLYWVLDIHFREDASTANAGNEPANLALLRKIAFNFTKPDPAMAKKTTKKRMIDFMTDLDLFKRLVFDVIPGHAE